MRTAWFFISNQPITLWLLVLISDLYSSFSEQLTATLEVVLVIVIVELCRQNTHTRWSTTFYDASEMRNFFRCHPIFNPFSILCLISCVCCICLLQQQTYTHSLWDCGGRAYTTTKDFFRCDWDWDWAKHSYSKNRRPEKLSLEYCFQVDGRSKLSVRIELWSQVEAKLE